MIDQAKVFVAVNDYLVSQDNNISAAYELVTQDIFHHYGTDTGSKRREFVVASSAWQAWKNKL